MARPDPADRIFTEDLQCIPPKHDAETLLTDLRALAGEDLRPALMPEHPRPGWPPDARQLLAGFWEVSRAPSVLNSRLMSRQLIRLLQGAHGDTAQRGATRHW